MTSSEHRWYWAWRSWRASTWLVLYWTAIMWPAIVATATSEDVLAGMSTAIGIGVWVAGCGVIALGRYVIGQARAWIGPADGVRGGRPVAAVRKVLPFAAALVLLFLVAGPVVAAWHGPSEVESAVQREWQGQELAVPIGWGIGGSDPDYATAPVAAENVSCDETDADLDGAAVHVCAVVHCDVSEASFFGCPETTSRACAALVGDELVLVSATWSEGPSRLRERILLVPECTF